jgi:hypothetical protein
VQHGEGGRARRRWGADGRRDHDHDRDYGYDYDDEEEG